MSDKKDLSLKVCQGDKIKEKFVIKERTDFTLRQKELIELVLRKDSIIIFCEGPAGTAKSFLATYCGLKLLNDKKVSDIVFLRTLVESAAKGIGYLKGDDSEKFRPFIIPLMDKLEELLSRADIDKLLKEDRIKPIPANFLRGTNFNAKYIFLEEAQNWTFAELITAITRIGRYSKMIFCGDFSQADINGRSGFKKLFDIFNDKESQENGIFCFQFTKDDVVRSGVVKFILGKIEKSQ